MDIAHWIERHAAFSPEKTAVRFAGQDLSYAAFAARVGAAAGRLRALGVRAGDVVAFLGLNTGAPKGTIYRQQAGGGGGYGDPKKRSRSKLHEEVRDGVISLAAEQSIYGL